MIPHKNLDPRDIYVVFSNNTELPYLRGLKKDSGIALL